MKGIYILTSPSGKQYVGQSINIEHRTYTYTKGYGHGLIGKAIKKYGIDNFAIQTIPYPNVSKKALDAIEKWYIKRLNTKNPNGYNLTDGGDTNPMDDPQVRAYQKKVSGKKTAEMNKTSKRREQVSKRNKEPKYKNQNKKRLTEQNLKNWKDPEYRKKMTDKMKGNKYRKKKDNPNQLKLF